MEEHYYLHAFSPRSALGLPSSPIPGNLSPKKNEEKICQIYSYSNTTLWTSVFAQQTHHYSFAREKSNDDTKKRQEKKIHVVDGSGML